MKISIITVSYNSLETIGKTIQSVSNQNYGNIEYIIIDGGSVDGTVNLVNRLKNKETIFLSEKDNGIYNAMNKGLMLATGEVVGFLNSNDYYLSDNVINNVASIFNDDPSVEVVLGGVDFVKNDNLNHSVRTYSSAGFKVWMFWFGFMPPQPSVFVRRKLYEKIGFYKEDFKIAADYDFLVRALLINSAKYKSVNAIWVRMLAGGVSTSGWKSIYIITLEMHKSLFQNKKLSFLPLLLVRLPVKYLRQVFFGKFKK